MRNERLNGFRFISPPLSCGSVGIMTYSTYNFLTTNFHHINLNQTVIRVKICNKHKFKLPSDAHYSKSVNWSSQSCITQQSSAELFIQFNAVHTCEQQPGYYFLSCSSKLLKLSSHLDSFAASPASWVLWLIMVSTMCLHLSTLSTQVSGSMSIADILISVRYFSRYCRATMSKSDYKIIHNN